MATPLSMGGAWLIGLSSVIEQMLAIDTSKKDTLKVKKILVGKWIDDKLAPIEKDIRNTESFETAISQAKNIKENFSTNLTIFQGKQRCFQGTSRKMA